MYCSRRITPPCENKTQWHIHRTDLHDLSSKLSSRPHRLATRLKYTPQIASAISALSGRWSVGATVGQVMVSRSNSPQWQWTRPFLIDRSLFYSSVYYTDSNVQPAMPTREVVSLAQQNPPLNSAVQWFTKITALWPKSATYVLG